MTRKEYFFFIFLFSLLTFLTFNRHSKSTYDNYHSVIWGDKAGYYGILPACFILKFDMKSFDQGILEKTGNGFDIVNDKYKSKYFIGVSILELPFFLLAYAIATLTNTPLNQGFAPIFHWSIMIASIFYACFGMIHMYSFLKNITSNTTALFSVLLMFFGTNLYFFTVDQGGMSHVFSFFLICSSVYFFNRFMNNGGFLNVYIIIFIGALSILVRPTNAIAIVAIAFLPPFNLKKIGVQLTHLKWREFLISVAILIIVLTPQLLYWKYSTGKWFSYSYGDEGFDNILQPEILKTLFSPNNGLFINTPVALLFFVSPFLLFYKNRKTKWLNYSILFGIITWMFASWWIWTFGCSFGHRCYVEYYPLLIIPFALYLGKKNLFRSPIFYLSLFFVLFNLKMSYSVDNCWYSDDWDFDKYFSMVISPPK